MDATAAWGIVQWGFYLLAVFGVLGFCLFLWSLCAIAADSDKRQAELFRDQQPQPLSWLEQEPLDTIAARRAVKRRVHADVQAWKARGRVS